ncbi:LdOrf-6 peptide [Lymantria dispar multiple nucleopolyhedrovirus]|uniref:LdOrf-6 peptide n=1 Tax=Lymantria dispar multicapsid nuclear polyhedrosis virus TaxID=10449 RepID=Q9YMW8_NPVLD|nr:LdOrf-6 peptide [Lymantria dispar multiple nucleopolyhedrovirus]AAC70191.1 LdOrf-6 peptide [Lymantria dispar multiple nucleopolyhedrovirus]
MSEPDGRRGRARGGAQTYRADGAARRLIARRLIVSIGRLIASRTRSGLDGSIRYRYGKLISRTVRVDRAIVLKQFLTCQV